MNVAFLNTYCTKLASLFSPRRSIMSSPWRIEIKGEMWSVATDGRGILGYRIDGPYPPIATCPDSTMYADHIRQYLSSDEKGKSISLAALRKWCGKGTWIEEYDCDNCEGTGTFICTARCKEGHHCESCCSFSGCDGGEQKCTECIKGKKNRVPRIFGRVDGTLFDANLIACALDDVDEGPVDVAFGKHIPIGSSPSLAAAGVRVLYLTGPNWRFMLMPMSGMSSIEARSARLDRGELVLA